MGKKNENSKLVQETLLAIYGESPSHLTAENVVQHASDSGSRYYNVLHPLFEWDDQIAGHKWRLEQAIKLIQSVTVRFESDPDPVRFFVHLSSEKGYRSIGSVMESETLSHVLLNDAKQEYMRFYEKFKRLARLNELWASGHAIFGIGGLERTPKKSKSPSRQKTKPKRAVTKSKKKPT